MVPEGIQMSDLTSIRQKSRGFEGLCGSFEEVSISAVA